MEYRGPSFSEAVKMLVDSASLKTGGKNRNLQMPGDPHYQPKDLQPYLGYDQRVSWQILVAWFWMVALVKFKIIPKSTAKLLTKDVLAIMLAKITTTKVTKLEKTKTKHDILALLMLMRRYLPVELHRYLHLGLTSYDVISTAYAIQFQQTFLRVFYPQARVVGDLWWPHIEQYAGTLQMGRTHLQDALPITAGFWLATRYSRFVDSIEQSYILAKGIPGKFSGAVGTKAAILTLSAGQDLEQEALNILGLHSSQISTQIVPPESGERFFHELKLVSGILAQFGEDVRHLQASSIGEVTSASSTSSTMSHKGANPVAAENIAGMYRSVIGEFTKIMLNSQSDLQRDLRDSNVMRSYAAMIVFVYQQLLTTKRLLTSFKVDKNKCAQNFWVNGELVPAELLHLSLQLAGYPNAHAFVNKKIVPLAREHRQNLATAMDVYVKKHPKNAKLSDIWRNIPDNVRQVLQNPDQYTGQAEAVAIGESKNEILFHN